MITPPETQNILEATMQNTMVLARRQRYIRDDVLLLGIQKIPYSFYILSITTVLQTSAFSAVLPVCTVKVP